MFLTWLSRDLNTIGKKVVFPFISNIYYSANHKKFTALGGMDAFVTKIRGISDCDAANLDGIGLVDFNDFSILSNDWMETGPGMSGDIDGDEIVDQDDLSWLTDYWSTDCSEL